MTEGGTREYFRAMLEGVETMIRLPDCLFQEDIFETFPDFKVEARTHNLMYYVNKELTIYILNGLNEFQNFEVANLFKILVFTDLPGKTSYKPINLNISGKLIVS